MTDILSDSCIAEADLRGKQGYAVMQGTAVRGIVLATAGLGKGILAEPTNPNTDESARVMLLGIYDQAVTNGSGTAIVADDWLTAGTGGKLVKATDGTIVFAKARGASTTDGGVIPVQVISPYLYQTS